MSRFHSSSLNKALPVPFLGLLSLLVLFFSLLLIAPSDWTHAADNGDWPTYLMNNARSGFNATDTIVNAGNVSHLHVRWHSQVSNSISVQPAVVKGISYWGAWDGNEYATDTNNHVLWHTYIGQTKATVKCGRPVTGVASSATVTTLSAGGASRQVVLVGGGDAQFYALDATNGRILWKTRVGVSPNELILDSPAFYQGNIYIGVSSYGEECASGTFTGKLLELDAASGTIKHTLPIVTGTCHGGGIWGSPTIDEVNNALYVATGNAPCQNSRAFSLLKLNPADLSLMASWRLPASQMAGGDDDFGSTPTLFQATINGKPHQMVGLLNKNHVYYAFDRANIGAGPVWQKQVASGQNSISPSEWDGTTLYVADGNTTINGKACQGSIRALNPVNGNFLWEYCASARVEGPVTGVSGLVFAGTGKSLVALDAHTGKVLFSFNDANAVSDFWGAATISNGIVYVGNKDGSLYGLGL